MVLFNEKNAASKLNLKKGGIDRLDSVGSCQKVTHFKHRIGGRNHDLKKKHEHEKQKEEDKENEMNEEDNNNNEEEEDKFNNQTSIGKKNTIGNRFNLQSNYSDQVTKDQTNNEIIQFTTQNEDENLISMKTALNSINRINSNSISKEIANSLLNEMTNNNNKRDYYDNNNSNNLKDMSPYDPIPIHFIKEKHTLQIMSNSQLGNPEMYKDKRYSSHNEYEDISNNVRYKHNKYHYHEPPDNIINDYYNEHLYSMPSNEYDYFQCHPMMMNRPPPEINPPPYYRKFPPSLSLSPHKDPIRSWKDNDYYVNMNNKKYLSKKTSRKEPIHLDYADPKLIRPQGYQQGINYQQQQPIQPYYETNDIEYFEAQQMRQTRISPQRVRPITVTPNYQKNYNIQSNNLQGNFTHNVNGDNARKPPQNNKAFLNWLSNSQDK